jgi:hypothetical protein
MCYNGITMHDPIGITVVSYWRYDGVTVVFKRCSISVSLVLHGCDSSVTVYRGVFHYACMLRQ